MIQNLLPCDGQSGGLSHIPDGGREVCKVGVGHGILCIHSCSRITNKQPLYGNKGEQRDEISDNGVGIIYLLPNCIF